MSMSFQAARLAFVAAIASLVRVNAVDNGLARTPQMGWNNWNAFACDVSEELLVQTADLIVGYGLRDLGYEYVVLDDCWSAGRNASNNNTLIPDPIKFPRGMSAVAEDMHVLDLKFGMYSDAGRYTCGMYEGSLGHETTDANTFASWGVDYLKYDNCYNEGYAGNQAISSERYRTMGDALNATGRPILYSLCNWGEDYPWNWGSTIANSWRMSGDIFDMWDKYDARCPCEGKDAWNCELPGFHCSITNIMNKVSFIVSKAQPGAWNDLDMLEVGNGGMTDDEYVAHFSMWSVAKSPLLIGADIRKILPQDLAILNNAAVIAVNQDPMGQSAGRRWMYETEENGPGAIQLWTGNLRSTTGGRWNDMVVLLINGKDRAIEMNATLIDIFSDVRPKGKPAQASMAWEVRDLWADRMSTEKAAAIIAAAKGNSTVPFNATAIAEGRFNTTQTSYADGLKSNSSILLGKVIGTVEPQGNIKATVPKHGAVMYRLRALPSDRNIDEL
ncbi:hypothetical protein HYALB_00007004 [Hymenoscyphus albidus]|uniref:Alpha-galactosidase n=1 Tax=Hymenoscyphus albidus TaxID=595503 RepID=A0A9N9LLI1_9HELO|nr:hypothetical protein HYALB_00007004 [Hymenoscyphus albidus]